MTFEKRGAMPDRNSLVCTLWLASLLTLLASVLDAPLRPSAFASSFRPNSHCRIFTLPQVQPTTHLRAAIVTDEVLQVNGLPAESEEQDWADALDEPRVTFLIPCSFHKTPDLQPISPRSIPSLYPLRC